MPRIEVTPIKKINDYTFLVEEGSPEGIKPGQKCRLTDSGMNCEVVDVQSGGSIVQTKSVELVE